jgi:hypothetical protein
MYYLPPDSGERVSMAVTILLAFSVFQMVVAEALPKTSDTTPYIGRQSKTMRYKIYVLTTL